MIVKIIAGGMANLSIEAWMFSFSVNRVIAKGSKKRSTYIKVRLLIIT